MSRRIPRAAVLRRGRRARSLALCRRLHAGPELRRGAGEAGDGKGYVAGDGAVETIAGADRGEPVALAGTTLDGTAWSTAADAAGKVVVAQRLGLVVRARASTRRPTCSRPWESTRGAEKPVAFVGIDIRDERRRRRPRPQRPRRHLPVAQRQRERRPADPRAAGQGHRDADHARARPAGPDRRPGPRRGDRQRPSRALVDDVLAEQA